MMRSEALLLLQLFGTASGLVTPSQHALDLSRRALILTAAASAASAASSYGTAALAAGPMAPKTTWELEGGVEMPTLALNTAGMTAEASALAVRESFKAGITHVDFHPGRERDGVGAALRGACHDRRCS